MNTIAENKAHHPISTRRAASPATPAPAKQHDHVTRGGEADRAQLSREAQEKEGGGMFAALSGLMDAFGGGEDALPSLQDGQAKSSTGAAKLRDAMLKGASNGTSGAAEINAQMTFSGKAKPSVRDQKELIERIYKETAEKRMGMENSEKICLYYAKDIYKALMAEKGNLPDLKPRIYGWEREKEGSLGQNCLKNGGQESADFAHNLVVIEDANGKPVMVLDPWETGAMWNDTPMVFDSVENYRSHREGGIGGLSGTLKPWPEEDEYQVLTGLLKNSRYNKK